MSQALRQGLKHAVGFAISVERLGGQELVDALVALFFAAGGVQHGGLFDARGYVDVGDLEPVAQKLGLSDLVSCITLIASTTQRICLWTIQNTRLAGLTYLYLLSTNISASIKDSIPYDLRS